MRLDLWVLQHSGGLTGNWDRGNPGGVRSWDSDIYYNLLDMTMV